MAASRTLFPFAETWTPALWSTETK